MTAVRQEYHGILLLHKPSGPSSHDAVARVREITRQRSIGHAGTLDPAAEGLLVLLLGRATKIARFLQTQDKEYIATVRLGIESATYDAEGVPPDARPGRVPDLSTPEFERVLDQYRGTFDQPVPPVSAVHVDGERLYKKARRGDDVSELPTRRVTVHELELLDRQADSLKLRIRCSKGTYIRSIAHDLGRRLGCGAYLSALTRTRIGDLTLEQAITLEEVQARVVDGTFEHALRPLEQALTFRSLTVEDEFRTRVADGVRPCGRNIASVDGDFDAGETVLVRSGDGSLLAIGTARIASTRLHDDHDDEVISYERVLR